MSLQRLATPFATTAYAVARAAQQSHSQSSSICIRCFRTLYSTKAPPRTQRRAFVSATAHKPLELEPQSPPRNAGVPDTSIAGGKPGIDFARSGREQGQNTQNPASSFSSQSAANGSVPESEAQQPRPKGQAPGEAIGSVATPSPSPSSSQSKSPRKSKLRPRKAAMTLSPAAVEQLRELLNQPEPKLIRVGVKNRGCSGLAYHLEYVEKPGAFDEAVDQDGVKVLVDSKALFSIIGSEMDWVEDKLSRRFVFKNPNITEQCGCGESFSIS